MLARQYNSLQLLVNSGVNLHFIKREKIYKTFCILLTQKYDFLFIDSMH